MGFLLTLAALRALARASRDWLASATNSSSERFASNASTWARAAWLAQFSGRMQPWAQTTAQSISAIGGAAGWFAEAMGSGTGSGGISHQAAN